MPPNILKFIEEKRIGVLAVKMLDSSPHAATLHFAFDSETETFIFMTNPTYRKSEPLLKQDSTPASLVIGVDESDLRTLQLDGIAKLSREPQVQAVYLKKFPEKEKKLKEDILITFKPTWWRYTDWTGSTGKTILASTDSQAIK